MAVRSRTWLLAALLLCVLIFQAAADSVCIANDTREECSARPSEDIDSSSDDDEDDAILSSCVDQHENCKLWSDEGECDTNPNCECIIYQMHMFAASLIHADAESNSHTYASF